MDFYSLKFYSILFILHKRCDFVPHSKGICNDPSIERECERESEKMRVNDMDGRESYAPNILINSSVSLCKVAVCACVLCAIMGAKLCML